MAAEAPNMIKSFDDRRDRLLDAIIEEARTLVEDARTWCGYVTPGHENKCSHFTQRGRRCPDCPYMDLEDLDGLLRALDRMDAKGNNDAKTG